MIKKIFQTIVLFSIGGLPHYCHSAARSPITVNRGFETFVLAAFKAAQEAKSMPSIENKKTKESRVVCTECERTYSRQSNLNRHMRFHNRDYRFTCKRCPSLQFMEKHHLIAHLNSAIHKKKPSFRCRYPSCSRSYFDESNRRRHEKDHEKEKRA